MTRQIVLDTETTGLDPKQGHRIIEIGCIELVNRQLTGRHFHYYLNPEREVEIDAIKVHGITNEFLADKPRFNQIVQELVNFIQGAELIIHNAAFDVGFLDHEFKLTQGSWGCIADLCHVFDTLTCARQLHPGQKNNLDALCKRYEIDNSQRDLHGALLDAQILARVYLAMTGGQVSLFDETSLQEQTHKVTTTVIQPTQLKRQGLIIATPSEQELAEHAAYLAVIRKASGGKCLWET